MTTPARALALPLALALAQATLVSCAGDGLPLGLSMNVERIVLARLDEQLRLRVFAKADFTCNEDTGRVQRAGADATNLPGGTARPDQRCGAEWSALRASMGEATPVDTCFTRDDARAEVSLAPGRYLVLVEGSGDAEAAGGGTRKITLGSGCIEVEATSGATINRTLRMIEQAGAAGTCGDGMVSSNELCDTPGNTEDCNARCRFPERVVSAAPAMGQRKRPSVAWAAAGNLAVAWHSLNDDRDDVWVHFFDNGGRPINAPAALANDHGLDLSGASEQRNVRLTVAGASLAGTWETAEYAMAYDVDGVVLADLGDPLPVSRSVRVSSMGGASAHPNRTNPTVAAAGSAVLFAFENGQGGISIARTTAPGGAMPAAETALPLTGPGATMPSGPVLAAMGTAGFVLAWTGGTPGARDVYATRLNTMGALVGSTVRVNVTDAGDQDQVAVAATTSDVLVAWRDASRADATDPSGTTIRWRRLAMDLAGEAMDRVAVTTPMGDQANPTVALGDGVGLLAWEQGDGTVRGRVVSPGAGGVLLNRITGDSADFLVNAAGDEAGPGRGPRVAPTATFGGANRFVVAWEDQGTRNVHFRTLIK